MTELTPEQIDSMPAGPEINMLVAERVMQLGGEYQHDFQENGYGQCNKCDASNDMGAIRRGGRYCTIPDNYSEDIAAAWEVIEKFKADGWAVGVQWELMDGGGYWFCVLDNPNKEWYGFAETATLAICRSALKAVLNNG